MTNHLFELNHLDQQQILKIIKKASALKKLGINNWIHYNPKFHNKILANLFFEPSTRTEYSFFVAASKLGLTVMSFDVNSSSLQHKTETLYDTVKTFESMRPDIMVIRHPITNYYNDLQDLTVPIINGGDGTGRHPTQALLDFFTIYNEFDGDLENKRVLIIGDIMHSRVAKTNVMLFESFGIEVRVTGPKEFADPVYNNIVDFKISTLKDYDVIMLLRYQTERHAERYNLSGDKFSKLWGMNHDKYDMLKETAIIMHPGPVNRGVEIDGDLVESPKSRILQQVENGVHIRAALISLFLENKFNEKE